MLSREKVEAVLFKMGMPANVKGFGYIVDCVLILEKDSKIKTTYLYFKVAQQNGTTGQRVEPVITFSSFFSGFGSCTSSASSRIFIVSMDKGRGIGTVNKTDIMVHTSIITSAASDNIKRYDGFARSTRSPCRTYFAELP